MSDIEYSSGQSVCMACIFLISALTDIYALALFLTGNLSGYYFLISILCVGCIFHILLISITDREYKLYKCVAHLLIFISLYFIVNAIWIFDESVVISFIYGIAAIIEFCLGDAILSVTSN